MQLLSVLLLAAISFSGDGNRYTYLDEVNPYYVWRDFPKLIAPQWVGEPGVEAVIILAIDDMRDPARYESYLRPILSRLRKIDGRAPLSIMTCSVNPTDPQLQTWLKEGVNIDCHTVDHPCPILARNDLTQAKSTYDRCVDLMAAIPNNRPVAFRTPCCDSLNTPSPRLYSEIIHQVTPQGKFLSLDTSVFNVFTANDAALPRELVMDELGRERFRKYLPLERSFVNVIEDYPYPYIIGGRSWQFPCVTPSDWQAQHLQQPFNPITVRDMQSALDATVIKQGVYCLVFHPHGWIRADQVIAVIDHAVAKHGSKVKFLNFREALERLEKHLLLGQSVRHPKHGGDNGVRLLDLDSDGLLDVVIANPQQRRTRRWLGRNITWAETDFPAALVSADQPAQGAPLGRFGVSENDEPVVLIDNHKTTQAWTFSKETWLEHEPRRNGLTLDNRQVTIAQDHRDLGVRLRDVDGDGSCELLVGNPQQNAVFHWSRAARRWQRATYTLPRNTLFVDEQGHDAGLRFVDVDEDGFADVYFSNHERWSLDVFDTPASGWKRRLHQGEHKTTHVKTSPEPTTKPDDATTVNSESPLPMAARRGTNNGLWFSGRHVWVQNEDTATKKDLVERRSFNELLGNHAARPKTPDASLASMRARPGFTVELVASEPLVADPVALAWGPDGKLWVAEMADYPLGIDGGGKPGGRIKILESTKQDGRYDKATIFLEGLRFPNGVMPWRQGVLISCAPDILFAEDLDGDNHADRKLTLYTGFVEGNHQHRVNGFSWGLDNWLHVANGDSGGEIRALKSGVTKNISGRDFRIRPDEGAIDLQTGQTQFGRNRDDWGNWFGGNNSNPMYHFAIADEYLRRNPHLPSPEPRVQVSDQPGVAAVYPISRTLARFNDFYAANRFTSANSPLVYRDDLFGAAFSASTFVSEPVHNLVHREVIRAQGTTFVSSRAADEQNREFLASSDNWFRPTMLRTGPDGALWIVDMYRQVIEHPQYIPLPLQIGLDFRAGADRGRIYRVYPLGTPPRPMRRLDKLNEAELVAALDSPNGWQRDMVHQMLLWRQEKAVAPRLENLLFTCSRALARLHALCILDGLRTLRAEVLVKALGDEHAGVRRHAVRLAVGDFTKNSHVETALLRLTHDVDAQVRLQVAYTLGEWRTPSSARALARLAARPVLADGAVDPYLRAAVFSSLHPENLDAVLLNLLQTENTNISGATLDEFLRIANAFGNHRALSILLKAAGTAPKDDNQQGSPYVDWQLSAIANLLDALGQRGHGLNDLRQEGNDELRQAIDALAPLFLHAQKQLSDPHHPLPGRVLAARLLARDERQTQADTRLLTQCLTPQTPSDLQTAALQALARCRTKSVRQQVPDLVMRHWSGMGPALRTQALEVLLSRPEWLRELLTVLEKKKLPAAEVDMQRRLQLLDHGNADIRQRAAKLFAGPVDRDRQKIITSYHKVLSIPGNSQRGQPLFAKRCAVCHRLGNVGNQVGPDLGPLVGKPLEYLLTAVLDPNQTVEARYVNYVALMRDGRTLQGVLTRETANDVTLVDQTGKAHTLLRADLEQFSSTGKSAMPEGLEKDITPQDLADIFAHLRGAVAPPAPKTFPGNKPETVKPAANGSFALLPSTAAIHGPSVVLEARYGNLGFWTSEDDRAVWTVELPQPTTFTVTLDWACPANEAGKHFLLDAGTARLTGKITATANWDEYRQMDIGDILLPAGKSQLEFRSATPFRGCLLDLRGLRFHPKK